MKKTNNQSGFAHLIIIVIILAVALVGTLGFVFWQNFVQPKTSVTQSNSTNKSSTSAVTPAVETPVEDKNTLKITDWGIKGVYNGTHPVKYNIVSDSETTFTSSDLTGGCNGFVAFTLRRFKGDVAMSNQLGLGVGDYGNKTVSEVFATDSFSQYGGNKHIGNYYYVFISPQQGCSQSVSDPQGPIALKVSDDVHTFFGTLTAI